MTLYKVYHLCIINIVDWSVLNVLLFIDFDLSLEHVLDEVLLQTLISVVDAELFE